MTATPARPLPPKSSVAPSRLLLIARRIRHAPGLARLEGLWRGLRPLYHRLLELFHGRDGIPVSLGHAGTMRVPASFITNEIDPHELLMIGQMLGEVRADTCFYDIGASIGLHSLVAGEKLGDKGAIHAFEPDGPSGSQYRDNTRLLRHRGIPMRLSRCFVADRSRDFSSEACNVDLGHGHAANARSTRQLYYFDPSNAAEQAAVALDDYVAAGARPPTVIKCDTEGAELLMLRGARETLRRHRPVIFLSVHPTLLPRFGHEEQQVFAELTDAGYRWKIIDHDGETHVFAQPVTPVSSHET
jgi:FkbM family methyltransferase